MRWEMETARSITSCPGGRASVQGVNHAHTGISPASTMIGGKNMH